MIRMQLSAAGEAFLKQDEACSYASYRDTAGNWTIGWGHKGDDVGPGMWWTESECEYAFQRDIGWVEDAVNELVRVPLTQGQFDALCSFVFNIGRTKFAVSTLLRKLNLGDYDGARRQFARWNKDTVDGKLVTVRGLTVRRTAEAAMFH